MGVTAPAGSRPQDLAAPLTIDPGRVEIVDQQSLHLLRYDAMIAGRRVGAIQADTEAWSRQWPLSAKPNLLSGQPQESTTAARPDTAPCGCRPTAA